MAAFSQFMPHGLITTPGLHVQYQAAHIANYEKDKHDMKEHFTVELLENILNKVIFKGYDNIFINSQQPPGMDSNASCDIVVKYTERDSIQTRVLCFVECKRTKKTQAYSLRALENQALIYCQEYLARSKTSVIYAATAVGAHMRLWKYSEGDDGLMHFWGSPKSGNWKDYKDVGEDRDSVQILDTFMRMLQLAPSHVNGMDPEQYGSRFSHLPLRSQHDNTDQIEQEFEDGEHNQDELDDDDEMGDDYDEEGKQ